MFIILRTNPDPKGYLKKKKFHKKLAKNDVYALQTNRGLPFFILEIPENISDKCWKIIAEKCGRYASRIIAPRSLSLPDFTGLKRFISSRINSVLTFNTAKKIIENAELNPRDFSVTLTDRNALQPAKALTLLPLSSTVRIITSFPEKYASVCRQALDEFGASIIIRSAYEKSKKTDIVICCDGVTTPEMHNSAVFIFNSRPTGKINFMMSDISLSKSHSEILPDNIDPLDFVGAITELCGDCEYKNSVFDHIECDCNECEFKNPEKCLKCFVTNL